MVSKTKGIVPIPLKQHCMIGLTTKEGTRLMRKGLKHMPVHCF